MSFNNSKCYECRFCLEDDCAYSFEGAMTADGDQARATEDVAECENFVEE